MGIGNHFGKILVPLIILCKHSQVVRLVIFTARLFIIFMVRDHIPLASDNWLNSSFLRLLNEIDCAKEITMIRQGHG